MRQSPDSYAVLAGVLGRTVILRGDKPLSVRVASVQRAGQDTVLYFRTLQGADVQRTCRSASLPIVASWVTRLASMMHLAWGDGTTWRWDRIIKESLEEYGLPVDRDVDWDKLIPVIFRQAGLDLKDPELRDDAVQEALSHIILRGSLLKFNPDAMAEDSNKPLEKKCTSWVVQLLMWQFKSEAELGKFFRIHHNKNDFSGDTSPKTDTGEEGRSLFDTMAAPTPTPHEEVEHAEDIHGLKEFRSSFAFYLRKHREGEVPRYVMALFDLITAAPNREIALQQWIKNTDTSYSFMRKILQVMRVELNHFAQSLHAPPGSRITQYLNDLRLRTIDVADKVQGEPDLSTMMAPAEEEVEEEQTAPTTVPPARLSSIVQDVQQKTAARHEFMRSIQNEIVRLASEDSVHKQARPRVVDTSVLYVVMEMDPTNYLNMQIRFGGPGISKTQRAGTSYSIDVGLYGPDRSLPEAKIKKQLSALVFPSMRADVPEEFHDLLEKVIRELRGVLWENAVAYFEIPKERRPMWKHTLRMNVLTLQDVKVNIAEQSSPSVAIPLAPLGMAASLEKELNVGTSELKDRFATLKRAAEEAPENASAKIEGVKQKLLDMASKAEILQSHLDMTPDAEEKFAGFKRAADEEPEEVELAVQDFFLGLDEIMAEWESLADTLGVELVAPKAEDGPDGAEEVDDVIVLDAPEAQGVPVIDEEEENTEPVPE